MDHKFDPLVSYRAPSAYSGWIGIHAVDPVDAAIQAWRSQPLVHVSAIEVWCEDEDRYVPIEGDIFDIDRQATDRWNKHGKGRNRTYDYGTIRRAP